MPRTAETLFIGDAASVVRAAQEAAAATEGAEKKIVSSNARVARSHREAADSIGKAGKVTAIALAGIGFESVKSAVALEKSMTMLHTQIGISTTSVHRMTTAVEGMAASVGTGPEKLAESLYHIESTGLRGAKALEVLKLSAEGAKVGNANLVDVTNALNAAVVSGIKGSEDYSKAMGALNATVAAGDMHMQDLAEALGTGVLAPMKTYGLSLNDVGAALAVFGDNNIRGAEAATKLTSAVRIMAAPSSAASKALGAIGLSTLALSKDMRSGGLIQALEDLKKHLHDSGATAEQQGLVIARAFGGRQSIGVTVLLNQLERLKEKQKDVADGAGGFEKSWQGATHTLSFQLDKSRAAAEALGDRIGQVLIPALTKLLTALDDSVKWLGKHETAAIALAAVVGGALTTALTVYAYTKAVAFIAATKNMIGAMVSLAAKVGLISGSVEASLAGQATAAETAAAGVTAAEAGIATAVTTTSDVVVAETATMAASFAAMLGPIAAVAAAIYAISHPQKGSLVSGGKSALQEHLEAEHPSWYHASAEGKGPASNQALNHRGTRPETQNTVISEAAAKYGIDPKIEFGVWGNETSFGRNVNTSSAGAMGDFQFIPETAKAYHYPLTNHPNAKQFREQAGASAHYLSDLIKQNHGNVNAALEQYSGNTPGYAVKAQKEAEHYGSGSSAVEELINGPKKKAKKQAKLFTPHGGTTGFFEAPGTDYTKGKEEEIAERLDRLGKADKIKLLGISGYRSAAHSIAVGGFAKDPHTRGEASDTEGAQKIAEAILRKFGLTRPFPGAKEADHIQLLPGVTPLPRSGGSAELGTASSALEAIKKAQKEAEAHLILTAAQKTAIKSIQAVEVNARQGVEGASGLASGLGETWQRARGVQESKRKSLSTAQGASEAALIDRQDILTTQAQKKLYQRAVRELQVEVKALQKLRKQYLSLASHARGNAKKEALNRAAQYAGRIGQAQEEAKAYGGHIADSEAAIETAQNVLSTQLPEEIGAADLSSYQAANNKIDMEVRAGVKTEAEGKAAKEGNARSALTGSYGPLSAEGVLQVKGDLLELSKATTEATAALEAHTEALKESAKALSEFAHIADAIGVVEAGSFAKSLADSVNGQIGGFTSGRRMATVGSGSAASY